jgi:hypothetical protein
MAPQTRGKDGGVMTQLFLKKTLRGFEPADEPSEEAWKKYKLGHAYRAEIVKPRSYQHHKLAMALLSLTYENLPEPYEGRWPTFTAFRRAIAEAAAHVDEYVTLDGEVRRVGRSMSYDSIPDDVEFGRVVADMMTICAQILGVSQPELAAEVSRYASDKYGMAA